MISGFAHDSHSDSLLTVDFSKARRLDRGGSTCDAYECTIQRRRVFVKRLKPEYRDNPLYRAAFDKEYDLGVSLSHPSLPRYVGYGRDYIVMDFVEGDTLADLIKRNDPRLKDKRFVNKLLSELTDAVEYLHNRNIVHCDIKADNIIISPYNDRPATLIDLDKAYTAWIGSTPGDPAKYGCDGCDDGMIDFRGIGMIADKLGQNQIASVCRDKGVTAETLRKTLTCHTSRNRFRKWSAVLAVAGLFCVMILWTINKYGDHTEQVVTLQTQSGSTETPLREQKNVLPTDTKTDNIVISEQSEGSPARIPVAKEPKHSSPADNTKVINDKPDDDMKELDNIVRQYYGPLYNRHKYLRQLAANPKISAEALLAALRSYADDQYKAQGQILGAVMKLYGLGDPFESINIVVSNKEWSRFMHADADIYALYSSEMKKRETPDSLKN